MDFGFPSMLTSAAGADTHWFLLALQGGVSALSEFMGDLFFGAFLPSLMIAGGIRVFIPRSILISSIGNESRWISYSIAVFAGVLFTGCSCGVIPLFVGIYNAGVGVGPATAFLFAGPAVSVLAVVLTWQLFGFELALARTLTAIVLAVIVGLMMEVVFKGVGRFKIDRTKIKKDKVKELKDPWVLIPFFGLLFIVMGIMVWDFELRLKVWAQGIWLVIFLYLLLSRFSRAELWQWILYTGHFFKKIAVPMVIGIFIVGVIRTVFSPVMIDHYLGDNGLQASFIASCLGSVMYFGTCTGVLIVKGLVILGMAPAPALVLFLAGHSVSLPSVLAIYGIMGWKRTFVYLISIIVSCTLVGVLYGLGVPCT